MHRQTLDDQGNDHFYLTNDPMRIYEAHHHLCHKQLYFHSTREKYTQLSTVVSCAKLGTELTANQPRVI